MDLMIKEIILGCIRDDPLLLPTSPQNTVFVLHIDRPDWFIKLPSSIPVFSGKTGSEVFLKVRDWCINKLKWRKSGEPVDLLDYPTPLDQTYYTVENGNIVWREDLRDDFHKTHEIIQKSGIHREIVSFLFDTQYRDCCFHISEHLLI